MCARPRRPRRRRRHSSRAQGSAGGARPRSTSGVYDLFADAAAQRPAGQAGAGQAEAAGVPSARVPQAVAGAGRGVCGPGERPLRGRALACMHLAGLWRPLRRAGPASARGRSARGPGWEGAAPGASSRSGGPEVGREGGGRSNANTLTLVTRFSIRKFVSRLPRRRLSAARMANRPGPMHCSSHTKRCGVPRGCESGSYRAGS